MKVLYFAYTREAVGKSSETITGVKTIGELKELLYKKYQGFNQSSLVAVNLTMINNNSYILKDTDEVAFYPPMTGG